MPSPGAPQRRDIVPPTPPRAEARGAQRHAEAAAYAALAALDAPYRQPGGLPSDTPLGIRVYNSLAAAEPIWRELETRAVFTPYQRFDWIAPYHAARGARGELAIIAIEAGGRAVALLPLEIGRRIGLRRATFIGCEIGNGDFPMLDPEAAGLLTPETLLQLLREAAAATGGIDLISLFDQPGSWQGIDNPLLQFPHQPGPNNFYFGRRGATSFDRFDDKRLKNLKRRERRLADLAGPVELRAATSVSALEQIHASFLEQRAVRFAQQGIANVFAEPHFVEFFRVAGMAGLGEERPALIMHGLYAGERIVATAIGSFAGTHYSQYINATSSDPEIGKFRLIGILMHALFEDCLKRGATSIDMGLGDFEYKTDWTAPTLVHDGMIALDLRGQAGGSALLAVRRAKRAIKQHDRLWSLAKTLRAKLGQKPSAPQPD